MLSLGGPSIFSCFILLVLLVVCIPIESIHPSHENRSLGDEQLDDGIADTLVGETQFARLTWAERPLREQNLAHQSAVKRNTILISLISIGLSL